MNILIINSMKRLYESERVDKEDIVERVTNGVLTADEYQIITGEIYEG